MAESKTGSLLEAILAVQGEVGTLPKNAVNPHFKSKYVPLDTIVELVGPVLNKHGLVWMTFPGMSGPGGIPSLRYVLQHAATGENISDSMPLLNQKGDMQGLGSALTYARRYALCAVLNLVADDDDDANTASQKQSAGALARAQANMSDRAKALLKEADGLMDTANVPEATYKQWKDSTGYTEEGLGRLVDHLKKIQEPKS